MKNLVCTLDTFGGVPTVFINGKPRLLIGYKVGSQDLKTYKAFARSGYNTAHCNIKIDDVWLGPNQMDFEALHCSIDTILEADPRSFIMIELHANAPEWWISKHPEEQQVDRSGQRYGQSMASQLWQEEILKIISECVRESEKYYGDHVIAYFVGAGHTWEWFYRTPLRYVLDCSESMRQAFAAWLRKKYGTDQNLAKAWGGNVSIDEVVIPEWSDIVIGDLGSIRDPQRKIRVCDFFHFYNELLAELVIRFGTVVKNACGGKKLFGVFYGHLLDWLDNPLTAQHSGHFCLEKVLKSKVVDIIAGPNSYMNRAMGYEASFTSTISSIQLHGKLWLAETDTRTYLADPVQDFCGRPDTLESSLEILKRDFCHVLVCGVDMVWFSLFKGWFDDPAIMAFMAKARSIATTALQTDRNSVAQVAVIVSEQSVFALAGQNAYRVDPFISQEPRATDMLPHMGFPYDIFLASDLDLINVNKYRVFLFINAIWLDEDLRAIVDKKLKRDNRVLVWLGTPGVVRAGVQEANVSDLIGIHVRLVDEPSEVFIRILWDSHQITRRTNIGNLQPIWVDEDFSGYFGTNQILSPRVCVEDKNATSLGLYSRDGNVGFAVREHGTWSSVFIGAPFAPPAILRQIARWAGVHIYNQSEPGPPSNRDEFKRAGWNPDDITNPSDDILYANDNFIALHAKYKGYRRIVLPEPRKVIDVFSNRVVAEWTDVIEIACPGNVTYLFYIGQTPYEEVC